VNRRSKIEGMTLLELIMAVLLLNVVILTGMSMELGLRRIYRSTDLEILLLDEASPILAMVTKDINRGIGAWALPWANGWPYDSESVAGSYDEFRFRLDSRSTPDGTFGNDDTWVAYRWITGGPDQYQLQYFPDASGADFEILSRRVTGFSVTPPVAEGTSNIILQLRMDPGQDAGYTNPQVTLESSAQYRETSFN